MDEFDGSLDDLLSEGDSFFDDPKTLARKTTPKKSAKKSAAADLFGFDKEPEKPKTAKKEDDWLGLGNEPTTEKETPASAKIEPKIAPPKKADKLSFDDYDVNDILGIGSSETKPVKKVEETTPAKQLSAKKSSILSDILGETKKDDKTLSFDDILQSSSIRKKETNPPSIVEPKIVTPAQNEFTPTIGREPRRRRNSQGLIDPLGILTDPSKDDKPKEPKRSEKAKSASIFETSIDKKSESTSKASRPQAPKSADLPNWLDGKQPKPKQEIEQPKQTISEPVMVQATPQIEPQNIPNTETPIPEVYKVPDHMLESLLQQQKISSSHLELQNASIALQQQESQLMIAVQLKKYEDNLAEMQRKQQEMIVKQDMQFNSLLERQFAKQNVLENNMRIQQERINNHIQLLMSQPSGSSIGLASEEQQRKSDTIKSTFEENKKFYDDIIESLKQKHHEEVFLLEESYKKQLTYLENSIESTELRLKTEIENINKHFNEKIETLQQEKQILIKSYEEKIKQINEQNINEIETIKENCKITIADVRNEYKQMIDDITKSKTKEQELLLESGVITKRLSESLEMLNENTQVISEIQNKFCQERQILSDIKHETLSAKEQEIKMMRESLEKQRNANDAERAQLLVLVRSLEGRVAEQTQATREERWALQQATATLTARSAALDREAEFMKKNLEREREQIKSLKETLLAEHENIVLKLTEEKLAIAAEKSRLETSAKLANSFDQSKAKVEIEAALKLAKETTELTDKEREILCRQQCEVEILKRNLHDRESKLKAKEHELEKLFRIADQKYRDGEKALNEAKLTEHKYTERLKDIQKQLISLSTREKRLTEEKISLSKERLALHGQMKDIKKCGLCEADNFNSEDRVHNLVGNERNVSWGTDAEILRLKFDMENENIVSRENSVINDSDT